MVALFSFSALNPLRLFAGSERRISSWACYYGREDITAKLSRFDLAILAPGGQDPAPLRRAGIKTLVYVSAGEVSADGPYYEEARKHGLLIRHNENWNSWVVDLRESAWKELFFECIIPDALEDGYDGLFIDTLDSPLDMQRRDPDSFKGMERSAVELIKTIRKRYPRLLVAQNRGVEISRRSAPFIDYLLIEGLSSLMDLASGERFDVSPKDREFLLAKAGEALKANPSLTLLSLDYVPSEDVRTMEKVYEFSRSKGFVPFVSVPVLDRVFENHPGF